jgi:long-subunit acyl-CoA synthetase (AMP-forming)
VSLDAVPSPGWERYHAWTAGLPATPPGRDIAEEGDAYQLYTSGTTGHPKGAMLQQRAVAANIVQSGLAFGIAPGERSLAALPLFHAAVVPTAFAPWRAAAASTCWPTLPPPRPRGR